MAEVHQHALRRVVVAGDSFTGSGTDADELDGVGDVVGEPLGKVPSNSASSGAVDRADILLARQCAPPQPIGASEDMPAVF